MCVCGSVLFTMAKRLNIFEVPNLSNGDGGEENNYIDVVHMSHVILWL